MTLPKMLPCPVCGASCDLFTYEPPRKYRELRRHYVVCLEGKLRPHYRGPSSRGRARAVELHNERRSAQ